MKSQRLLNEKEGKLRILLVDDSLAFLEALMRFLSIHSWMEIVGRAHSGLDALEQVGQLRPDLVLMDLVMPEMNGLEATRRIKAKSGAPLIVILTFYDNSEYRAAAEAIGADGFIPKSKIDAQLLPKIQALFSESVSGGLSALNDGKALVDSNN